VGFLKNRQPFGQPMKANERQEFERWAMRNKIRQLLAIKGDNGIMIKTALLGALDKQEVAYLFNEEVCANDPGCACSKLHTVERSNGLVIIIANWQHGHKRCGLKILPSRLWTSFRNLVSICEDDIKCADKTCNDSISVRFDMLHKISLRVLASTMNSEELRILTGKMPAKFMLQCLESSLDLILINYYNAWQRAHVILPVI
jgi:hypothetical protein